MNTATRTQKALITITLLWIVGVGLGMKVLFDYAAAPGPSGNPPTRWPGSMVVSPPHEGSLLVMFAHPQCPCTRASLCELAKIMAHRQSDLKAYVLFLKPKDFSDTWTESDLWYYAKSIPGVTVLCDYEGQSARHFNVSTSGHTLLYDKSGDLLFSGGITGARGHAGDNQGADLVLSNIDQFKDGTRTTPVFGCPIIAGLNK
jgi:hypothetical protein